MHTANKAECDSHCTVDFIVKVTPLDFYAIITYYKQKDGKSQVF